MTASGPWLEIPLADYEGHMALPEIGQAQMLAGELESTVRQYSPKAVAVIGCAGGNGFDRLVGTRARRIVGNDINPAYVEATRRHYAQEIPGLELYTADIQCSVSGCAAVDLLYAALMSHSGMGEIPRL